MKTNLDCIPCFIRQGLEAARMVTEDITIQEKVIREIMGHLVKIEFTGSPPVISKHIHKIIRQVTNSVDPYKEIKQHQNDFALKLYPQLKNILAGSEDRLLTAIQLAIAGNVIDYGTMLRLDVESTMNKVLNTPLDAEVYNKFRISLSNAKTILYIGDNAGEIVFDKLLVEELLELGKQVTYAVRSGPIINDVTIEDAEYVGLDKFAEIITTGTQSPGVVLEACSNEFNRKFNASDLIISKGQGNYEGLPIKPNLFKLLMVKCELVAMDIGGDVKVGDIIFIDT
jgi:uncharacterized protein with ATP-grasp and redox domains